eukprot:TRINITY_DN39371_c0_g1_i1.p1 TRINITY_DN39371_c0_g1~~TRINITY_DN39371_c0_g1_i1.p1  ORF type:complete len:267 (+),score=59.29 TRINITY_DN39371_c0_g1_i1:1050-1850(+)
MVRTFGPTVPKGLIYALNPALDLIFVPYVAAKGTAAQPTQHFRLIRIGLAVAAMSPVFLTLFNASIPLVMVFVLALTAGDVIYNTRLDAYALAVAPNGHEGVFAGASCAAVFLADVPVGMLGGALLETFCPSDEDCNSQRLFGALWAFALLTPLTMWSCGSCLEEPDAPSSDKNSAQAADDAVVDGNFAEEQGKAKENQYELESLEDGEQTKLLQGGVSHATQTADDAAKDEGEMTSIQLTPSITKLGRSSSLTSHEVVKGYHVNS